MGETLTLTASDGHSFGAYLARPEGKPRGGVVIIQEIFGVNSHIRSVADEYAADGYLACCPALYDRIKPGIELGYSEADIAEGLGYKNEVGNDAPLLDIAAARDAVAASGKVGVVGYCWGGLITWLTACGVEGFSAASSYYGGGIGGAKDLEPGCPVIFHFGDQDHAIPMSEVESVREAQPDSRVFVYPAGHGFNCEQRGSHHPESRAIARERTMALFAEHVG